jgi:3-isopropylmalate/(R)-2-methylmalate dehydratase large subunit
VRRDDGESLLWVDRHYIHEGSFQAFAQLETRQACVAEPGLTFAVADHCVPTRGSRREIGNPEIARMLRTLEENTAKHGIAMFGFSGNSWFVGGDWGTIGGSFACATIAYSM